MGSGLGVRVRVRAMSAHCSPEPVLSPGTIVTFSCTSPLFTDFTPTVARHTVIRSYGCDGQEGLNEQEWGAGMAYGYGTGQAAVGECSGA